MHTRLVVPRQAAAAHLEDLDDALHVMNLHEGAADLAKYADGNLHGIQICSVDKVHAAEGHTENQSLG